MNYTITESQYKRIRLTLLSESEDVGLYSEEDFIEVFIKHFRPWVRKTHGDEYAEYPLSYLVKKYFEEFSKQYTDYVGYGSIASKMSTVGRQMVLKGVEKLPTLRPNKKFTEKFQKAMNYIVKGLNLPDYVNMVIEEESPYEIMIVFNVDFYMMLKSPLRHPFDITKYYKHIRTMLETFMGIDFGNPSHGNLRLDYIVRYNDTDKWVNNIWKKEIRKGIKVLDSDKTIHSIQLKLNGGKVEIKVRFYDRYSIYKQSEIVKIREYIKSLGYNMDNFNIDW